MIFDQLLKIIFQVKCGTLTAKMVTKLFTCPGIHQNCILIDGETEYISPKEFTVRANKDKQKDWKGSIRIGKSNLRTLMEMRSLDFHDHPNQCSAKCQSRNYITPKDPTSDPSLVSFKLKLNFACLSSYLQGTKAF